MFKEKKNVLTLIIGIMFVGAVAIGLSACDDSSDDNTGETNEYYGWYGNGSSSGFTIKNFAQLWGFAQIVARDVSWTDKDGKTHSIEKSDFRGKTVTLAGDINMTGKSWEGVGHAGYSRDYPFNGTFDGNHKTISGLSGMTGLFIGIEGNGIVKNIIFAGVNLNYNYNGGAVAEWNKGKIQNISVNGTIQGGALGGGGVVNDNSGTVENCSFSGNCSIYVGNWGLGGIAGSNRAGGIIRNCGFTGNNTGDGGGIVSTNRGTIENCYSTGNVRYGGGIVGGNYDGTVRNCYSTGDTEVGGIAGSNQGGNATIQNCYATGNVTGRGHVGGIAGGGSRDERSRSVQNCVALNSSITETDTSGLSWGEGQSGRIVARFLDTVSTQLLSNNYGRSGLSVGSANDSITTTSDANGQHGADVEASDYNSQTWWQTTLNWDFDTIWEWDSARNLPKLRF
jgi:hypothetical protein